MFAYLCLGADLEQHHGQVKLRKSRSVVSQEIWVRYVLMVVILCTSKISQYEKKVIYKEEKREISK